MDYRKNSKTNELTAREKMGPILEWIEKDRCERTFGSRKIHSYPFGHFRVKGIKMVSEQMSFC